MKVSVISQGKMRDSGLKQLELLIPISHSGLKTSENGAYRLREGWYASRDGAEMEPSFSLSAKKKIEDIAIENNIFVTFYLLTPGYVRLRLIGPELNPFVLAHRYGGLEFDGL